MDSTVAGLRMYLFGVLGARKAALRAIGGCGSKKCQIYFDDTEEGDHVCNCHMNDDKMRDVMAINSGTYDTILQKLSRLVEP